MRFNTPDYPLEYTAWRGIPHTFDTKYAYDAAGVAYPQTAHIYHAYLVSFVAIGDPNSARLDGTPKWPLYESKNLAASEQEVQLVIHPGTSTAVASDVSRRAQCGFWNDPERARRLNK